MSRGTRVRRTAGQHSLGVRPSVNYYDGQAVGHEALYDTGEAENGMGEHDQHYPEQWDDGHPTNSSAKILDEVIHTVPITYKMVQRAEPATHREFEDLRPAMIVYHAELEQTMNSNAVWHPGVEHVYPTPAGLFSVKLETPWIIDELHPEISAITCRRVTTHDIEAYTPKRKAEHLQLVQPNQHPINHTPHELLQIKTCYHRKPKSGAIDMANKKTFRVPKGIKLYGELEPELSFYYLDCIKKFDTSKNQASRLQLQEMFPRFIDSGLGASLSRGTPMVSIATTRMARKSWC